MIQFKIEKSPKGHCTGFDFEERIAYVVHKDLASNDVEAEKVVATTPFDKETTQVDKETGEITTTRWWGVFYDESKYRKSNITKITGKRTATTSVEVTYLD